MHLVCKWMKLFLQLMGPDGILYEAVKRYSTYDSVHRAASFFDDKIYEALSNETVSSQYF
jgi:hypothetical protein